MTFSSVVCAIQGVTARVAPRGQACHNHPGTPPTVSLPPRSRSGNGRHERVSHRIGV